MKNVYKYDTNQRGFKIAAYISIGISLVILFLGLYFIYSQFGL